MLGPTRFFEGKWGNFLAPVTCGLNGALLPKLHELNCMALESLKRRDFTALYRSVFLASRPAAQNLWGVIDLICGLACRFQPNGLNDLKEAIKEEPEALGETGPLYLACSGLIPSLSDQGSHLMVQLFQSFVQSPPKDTQVTEFVTPVIFADTAEWNQFVKEVILCTKRGNHFDQNAFEKALIQWVECNKFSHIHESILLLLTRQTFDKPLHSVTRQAIAYCLFNRPLSKNGIEQCISFCQQLEEEGIWKGSLLIDLLSENFHCTKNLEACLPVLRKLAATPKVGKAADFAHLARICFLEPQEQYQADDLEMFTDKLVQTDPYFVWKCLSLSLTHLTQERWELGRKRCIEKFLRVILTKGEWEFFVNTHEFLTLNLMACRFVARNYIEVEEIEAWTVEFERAYDTLHNPASQKICKAIYFAWIRPMAEKYETPTCVNFWIKTAPRHEFVNSLRSYPLFLQSSKVFIPVPTRRIELLMGIYKHIALYHPNLSPELKQKLYTPFNASYHSLEQLFIVAHFSGQSIEGGTLELISAVLDERGPTFDLGASLAIPFFAEREADVETHLIQHLHRYVRRMYSLLIEQRRLGVTEGRHPIYLSSEIMQYYVRTTEVLIAFANSTRQEIRPLLRSNFKALIQEIIQILPCRASVFLQALKTLYGAVPWLFKGYRITYDLDSAHIPKSEVERYVNLLQDLKAMGIIGPMTGKKKLY